MYKSKAGYLKSIIVITAITVLVLFGMPHIVTLYPAIAKANYVFFELLGGSFIISLILIKKHSSVNLLIKKDQGHNYIIKVGFVSLGIYLLAVYLPELYFLRTIEQILFNIREFIFGLSVTSFIYMIPFIALLKWPKNYIPIIIYYFIICPIFLGSAFDIHKPAQGLYFDLMTSQLYFFGLVPYLLLKFHIEDDECLIKWQKKSKTNKYSLIAIGFLPSLVYLFSGLGGLVFKINNINILLITCTTLLMVAIQEEYLFRGFLFGLIKKYTSEQKAMFYVSVFFAICHWTYLLEPSWIFNSIMVFVSGYIYAYLYVKSNNLWWPITFHFIDNVLIAFFG